MTQMYQLDPILCKNTDILYTKKKTTHKSLQYQLNVQVNNKWVIIMVWTEGGLTSSNP